MTYTNIENAKSRTVRYGTPALYYYRQESVALTFDNIDFNVLLRSIDNWINLDVGLTARSLNGDFEALSLTTARYRLPAHTRSHKIKMK